MRLKCILVVAALAALMADTGCASGPKLADYVEPTLDKAQAATLKGHGGTYVTVVDNHSISGSWIQMSNMGGNNVTLTPGKHDLTIQRTTGQTMLGQQTWTVTHVFVAGHEYEVGPKNSMSFKPTMQLKDKTDGGVIALN